MSRPLISAVIPTYKRPDVIERSVGSVLAQTWRPLELIVIDDGSGDETPRVLESFVPRAKAADVSYRNITVPNGGAGLARNAGVEAAVGAMVAFLDDDDAWRPDKLEKQAPALTQSEAGVAYTRYVHHGHEDKPKPPLNALAEGWVFEQVCDGRCRPHLQTLLVRREVFAKVGAFIAARNFQDSEFCLRAALEFPFVCVREPLTVIYTQDSSISRSAGLEGDLRRDALKLKVLDEFTLKHGSHPRFEAKALRTFKARLYDEHIKHLLWAGKLDEARQALKRAMSECGELEILRKLKGKLTRARVLGWFGMKMKKP
jgi:glycosyltransferase involved in cell wall biosynthesis